MTNASLPGIVALSERSLRAKSLTVGWFRPPELRFLVALLLLRNSYACTSATVPDTRGGGYGTRPTGQRVSVRPHTSNRAVRAYRNHTGIIHSSTCRVPLVLSPVWALVQRSAVQDPTWCGWEADFRGCQPTPRSTPRAGWQPGQQGIEGMPVRPTIQCLRTDAAISGSEAAQVHRDSPLPEVRSVRAGRPNGTGDRCSACRSPPQYRRSSSHERVRVPATP